MVIFQVHISSVTLCMQVLLVQMCEHTDDTHGSHQHEQSWQKRAKNLNELCNVNVAVVLLLIMISVVQFLLLQVTDKECYEQSVISVDTKAQFY